uniref:Gsh1 n=1 Tax=Arundo donax TaxID=35708 RepID=A0A0A9EEN3_ARUDO
MVSSNQSMVPSVLASLFLPLSNQKSCPKCFVMIPHHITGQPAYK